MDRTEQKNEQLVTIGENNVSRRKFLKILGASSGAALVGCTDKAAQKILPYAKPEDEQIPGVAVWYNSTCTECSAGCGIQVRTREGRAVKVEGNGANPINRGGLCALGQASLQGHYDPDRVRQPLKRDASGKFVPVSWDAAYAEVAEALKSSGKKVFITEEVNGALAELITAWSKDFKVEHCALDLMQPIALARSCEMVFGRYGVPAYDFKKAEVILNFGADFLETWVSPVEYAKDWAKTRKGDKPTRLIHIEPRLSLTGANADLWLNAAPGTEIRLALVLLKLTLERGRGQGLREEIRDQIKKLVEGVTVDGVAQEIGVPSDKIILIGQYLADAQNSLVLAGGASTATQNPLPLYVAVNFLNLLLGNVGDTVNLVGMREPKTSFEKLAAAVDSMQKGEVSAVFVHKANPAYALPSSFGYKYAVTGAKNIISFSSHLDESAKLATLILPASSSLESWGDVRAVPGVYGLVQPTMRPVFDTRALGDILIESGKAAGKTVTAAPDFEGFVKDSWKKIHTASGSTTEFSRWWLECAERGGYFPVQEAEKPKIKIDNSVFALDFAPATFSPPQQGAGTTEALVLYPYFSVRSFDGRAANKPWLQELPDTITKIVWDSWVEIHPDTARRLGIEAGDNVTVRNNYGEVTAAAYLTPHVHKNVVAIPVGHGHSEFGRYAAGVGSHVLNMLPKVIGKGTTSLPLLSASVAVLRARGRADIVNTQGSDSQAGRDLARTKKITTASLAAAAADHGAHGHDSHAAHHEPKQMYHQREHPLYAWAMVVDLAACTGCSACVVACYAENNIPVVGKKICNEGREMSWLRLERYYDGTAEELQVSFLPMMCQHCGNAPCEPVCPVYATYHNEEGLNAMVYNRCVGTRYCSNNCSYKVRRFNWYQYEFPEPLNWQLNPDVTPRGMGIMEKCTFCVQRIAEGKDRAKDLGRTVLDGEIRPACVQSCPTEALAFGNLNDPESKVSHLSKSSRAYKVLDHHLNTQPAVVYLEDVKYSI